MFGTLSLEDMRVDACDKDAGAVVVNLSLFKLGKVGNGAIDMVNIYESVGVGGYVVVC